MSVTILILSCTIILTCFLLIYIDFKKTVKKVSVAGMDKKHPATKAIWQSKIELPITEQNNRKFSKIHVAISYISALVVYFLIYLSFSYVKPNIPQQVSLIHSNEIDSVFKKLNYKDLKDFVTVYANTSIGIFYHKSAIIIEFIFSALACYIWWRVTLLKKEYKSDKGLLYLGGVILLMAFGHTLTLSRLFLHWSKEEYSAWALLIGSLNNFFLLISCKYFDHKYNHKIFKNNKLVLLLSKLKSLKIIKYICITILLCSLVIILFPFIADTDFSLLINKANIFFSILVIGIFTVGISFSFRIRGFYYILPFFSLVVGLMMIIVQIDDIAIFEKKLNLAHVTIRILSLTNEVCFFLIGLLIGISWAVEKIRLYVENVNREIDEIDWSKIYTKESLRIQIEKIGIKSKDFEKIFNKIKALLAEEQTEIDAQFAQFTNFYTFHQKQLIKKTVKDELLAEVPPMFYNS